ncbi:hypothetical protein OAF45_00015 [Candidatus Latescibacteria bacterium]|nr:hypothetical protein [Candidatus Latescibacterota bacterium]
MTTHRETMMVALRFPGLMSWSCCPTGLMLCPFAAEFSAGDVLNGLY